MLKCYACNDKKHLSKITDLRSQYYVQAREALSNAEVDMLSRHFKGRGFVAPWVSPVRGVLKYRVTTIGGVIRLTAR